MRLKIASGLALTVLLAAPTAFAQSPPPAQQPPPKQTTGQPKPTPPGVPHEERYVGYYYPKPTLVEPYESNLQPIANVNRAQRVQFVTVISQGTLQSAYRVPYAVFAKGDKADRLIIVGLQSGELNTIYRMRAVLANMTTMSRLSPFFQERTVAEDATFYDLLKMMGFRELTITDGDKLALQVLIK